MEVTAELLDLVLYGRLDRKMECLFNNNTSYKGKFMLFNLGQTLPLATATDWLSQKLQRPYGFVMKLKLFLIGYNSPRAKVIQ